jgi:hypothetical protein
VIYLVDLCQKKYVFVLFALVCIISNTVFPFLFRHEMIKKMCGRRFPLDDALHLTSSLKLDGRLMSSLCNSRTWEDAKPSTIIKVLERLGELKVNTSLFMPHASSSILAIVPTLSTEEGRQLMGALEQLGVLLNFPSLKFDESVFMTTLEKSWPTLTISSCRRLQERYPQDATVNRFVGMRCLVDVRIAPLEVLFFFLAIKYVPLRNAVVNRLHELVPALDLEGALATQETIQSLNDVPSLLDKVLLRRISELVSWSAESSELIKILQLTHEPEVTEKVRKIFEDQIRVIDLDLEHACELFSHLGDVVESAVINQGLVDQLSARLFLSINELSCSQCCDILEDVAVLSESCSVPGAFIQKLRLHFFNKFREEAGQRFDTLPLVLLRRFALCGGSCSSCDIRDLRLLQRDCMSCKWRAGPLLTSACEALRALDALNTEFSVERGEPVA